MEQQDKLVFPRHNVFIWHAESIKPYVKCKVQSVNFNLEQDVKAQSGVQVWLYSFFKHSARQGWVVNAKTQLLYPRGRDAIPIAQDAELALEPVYRDS